MRHDRSPTAIRYEKLKERARARNVALALAGRDIGELPEVVNPERKARAASDFRFFCESYFPLTFHLPWSPDHLKVIAQDRTGRACAAVCSRWRCLAGAGKTTICECACIWAVLNGHREFVCLIGQRRRACDGHARLDQDGTRRQRTAAGGLSRGRLSDPVPRRDRQSLQRPALSRASGRTSAGPPARSCCRRCRAASASGAIIKVAGITGRIRGMKYKRADGQTVRPSLVVHRRSANGRIGPVAFAVRHARKHSGRCDPRPGRSGQEDLRHHALHRDSPRRHGGQHPLIATSIRNGTASGPRWSTRFPPTRSCGSVTANCGPRACAQHGDIRLATEFYVANREAMDAGAVVAWPERFNHDELSAIQHAMNLKLQDEAAFFAEYQNEPLPEDSGDRRRTDRRPDRRQDQPHARERDSDRLQPPDDVHRRAGEPAVLRRGRLGGRLHRLRRRLRSVPDQKRPYFTLRDARYTLSLATKASGLEGAIYAGLERLTDDYLGREWSATTARCCGSNAA